MFENAFSLGEDSIGNTFSEEQAHIMSGRLYFNELLKVIDNLRPDDPLLGISIDEMTNTQRVEQRRGCAIDLLRQAAALILQDANGDPGTFDESNEFAQLEDTTGQLNEVLNSLFRFLPMNALLLPVLEHVHLVARRIVGGELLQVFD